MVDPHGVTQVSSDGPIIRVVARGRFNKDGGEAFHLLVREAVEAQGDAPFAMLINNLQFEGATPDAYAHLESVNAWINSRRMVAKAMVLREPLLNRIMDQMAPSRRLQNIREFSEEAPALAWLHEELAQEGKTAPR